MKREITLINLTLINFKGIKNLTIEFKQPITSICGDNEKGKTTIMDAFLWLLFDKDSTGRKDFCIKTVDAAGESKHLDAEVNATLNVAGEKIFLKKIYREKWTKPRGQKDLVFSGHETQYYYLGIPCNQSDYQHKIAMLCDESMFRLLTNPLYFPLLPWKEQRSILERMAGEVKDSDIAATRPAFTELLQMLNGRKTLDEYKRQIASEKKQIKDDLDMIPARIDEVQRGLPAALDWAGIGGSIADTQNAINDTDEKIRDASKGIESENSKRNELQGKIGNLKSQKIQLEREATNHVDGLKFEFSRKQREIFNRVKEMEETIGRKKTDIMAHESALEVLRKQRESAIKEWHKLNAETLNFSQDTICPTCGQDLPADFLDNKKAEAERKFNTEKASRLELNVKQGKAIAAQITDAESKIESCKTLIAETEGKLKEFNQGSVGPEPMYEIERQKYLDGKNFTGIAAQIVTLEKELTDLGPVSTPDTTNLQNEKKELQAKLDNLKADFRKRDQIAAGESRIEELKNQQQNLSQKLSDLEKSEFTIAEFEKAKIDMVESRVNGMFRLVKFRMFNRQINGGLDPTCVCTINGVPFPDLNNAGKINAGLDVLSTLSSHHGISGPVWIDNSESVNKLLPIESQLIRLVVTKDTELIIN